MAKSERAAWAKDLDAPRYHMIVAPNSDVDARLRRDSCRAFHDMMDGAVLVNGYKYGDVHDAYPDRVDAIASLENRLAKYKEDGNVRWLADIANFAMFEFMLPRREGAHLGADESIGRVVPGVSEFTERSNENLNAPVAALRNARSGD